MELRHLRYFVAVAELLHFGRAAVQLRIAQPSLSHQIQQLERELQTALLERTNRRVRLTDPGRLFLEEAREILAHADRAAVVARRASRGEVGSLRVGFACWMDLGRIGSVVKRFDEAHPSVRVELHSLSVPAQIAALRDGGLDVGFIRPSTGDPSLNTEVLATEPFVVALPATHRLASKRRIALGTLARESYVVLPRSAVPQFYDLTLEACRDAGFVPHVRHEADHPPLLLALVAAGVGVSLVPASAAETQHRGVVFRPLKPSPRIIETAVAWRRAHASPMVDDFLKVVRHSRGST